MYFTDKEKESVLKDNINFDHFNHLYKEIDFKNEKGWNCTYI